MKADAKTLTVSAVTFALTMVLGLFPYVFLIPLLFTCVTRDWKLTLIEALFFGVLSLLYSYASPASFVAAAFIANPWIPIVPRILAGAGCHGVYVALRRPFREKEGKAPIVVPVIAACAVGSILNTALVVPCLVWRGGTLFGSFKLTSALLVTETLISGAIELAVAVVIVPPVAVTVGKALRLKDYLPYHKPEAPKEEPRIVHERVARKQTVFRVTRSRMEREMLKAKEEARAAERAQTAEKVRAAEKKLAEERAKRANRDTENP